VFVAAALPVRLARLDRQRRVGPDHPLVGTTWRLHEVGGPDHLVTLRPTSTEVRPAGGQPPRVDAVIEGTADDLLALVLGRPTLGPITYAGNPALAGGFTTAYGGP
jgi:hypothetical protein